MLRLKPFGVLQEQPAYSFEHRFAGSTEILIDLPTEVGEPIIEQLDDMKMVKNNNCLRQVQLNCGNVRGRHIDGHRLDLGARDLQPLPERRQCINALAVTSKKHSTGTKIEHDGQIFVTFADGNFINGDTLETFEHRFCKPSFQVPLFDFLNQIPTDSEVIGNILDCHMPRKFDDISFKCSGVSPSWIGEAKVDLQDGLTLSTRRHRNPQADIDLLSPNRQGVKNSHDSISATDIPAMTTGASESMIFLGDSEGNRPPADIPR